MPNYEYTKFGDKFLRRTKDSTQDWVEVPMDDQPEAEATVQAEIDERKENVQAFRTPHSNIKITRADGTVEEV